MGVSLTGKLPDSPTASNTLHWVLRLGIFMCFLGHGSFGIIAKPEWTTLFSVAGIPSDAAFRLMPFIGLHDLTIAALVLASPRPLVLLWATIWCLWTAALRPIVGLGMWEFLERAGNYGPPLALLLLQPWPRSLREWFAPIKPGPASAERLRACGLVLRVSIALLLIGHAGFGAFQHKAVLLNMYSTAGLPASLGSVSLGPAIGWFELLLAAAVLMKPFRSLLLFVCVYKIASELLYPMTGSFWWEFIERGGDYTAPIALIVVNGLLAAKDSRVPAVAAFAPAAVVQKP
jgi:hypothetical protein